jgi:hypothetical protein
MDGFRIQAFLNVDGFLKKFPGFYLRNICLFS